MDGFGERYDEGDPQKPAGKCSDRLQFVSGGDLNRPHNGRYGDEENDFEYGFDSRNHDPASDLERVSGGYGACETLCGETGKRRNGTFSLQTDRPTLCGHVLSYV